MANQQRNIKLIGIAGLALVAILGGVLVGYPLIGSTQRWADEERAAQEANDALAAKITTLTTTKEQLPEVIALNRELVAKFPNLPNSTDLLNDIALAAYNANMNAGNINSIQIGIPELMGSETNLASMSISLSVSGTGEQLTAFIAALYNTSRVIKIDRVAISDRNDGNTMTIEATTYLYASIEAPDGADTSNPTPEPTSVPLPPAPDPTPTNTPTPDGTEEPNPDSTETPGSTDAQG